VRWRRPTAPARRILESTLAAILILSIFAPAIAATPARETSASSVALDIRSASALIVDEQGRRIFGRNTNQIRPIASITKLMTAMVVLDSGVALDTPITIEEHDRDQLKHSRSRLRIGEATLSRREMLMVALIASDNRAAAALGRTTFPGGRDVFIAAMNRKAHALGMPDTQFVDSTGLDNRNRSSAEDLLNLVRSAAQYPFIREATSRGELTVYPFGDGSPLEYRNTNVLVRNPNWDVEVSKTGYINEAGHCLVMQTEIEGRRLYVVFLDAVGKLTPVGDSNRLRNWLLAGNRLAHH
jgi:D-alanyl-D-alanine endopeptidase (penicillin-binding protein 7)